MRKLLPALIFTVLAAMLLNGCGSLVPSPEDVIARAQEAIEKVQTYRLEEVSIITQGEETFQSSAQIKLVLPDRMHETRVQGDETSEIIVIDQTEYYRSSDEGDWQVRQRQESSSLDNLAVRMVESLDELEELIQLDDEKIDGADCFHYKGIEREQLQKKTGLDPSHPDYEERLKKLEAQFLPRIEMEFWIGKDDYLLRNLEVSYTRNDGEDISQSSLVNNLRVYDFDTAIQIEVPSIIIIEGVNLVADMRNMINDEDSPEHYRITCLITVSNQGSGTARDVKVFIESSATNNSLRTMKARPMNGTDNQIDLGLGERETFMVVWEYSPTTSSGEEFNELAMQNMAKATWIGEDGQLQEDVLIDGRR